MASDISTPPAVKPPVSGDPDRPTGKVVPILLWVVLVALMVIGGCWAYDFVFSSQAVEGEEIKPEFGRLTEAVSLFGKQIDAKWLWIPVLLVVLALGFAYSIWMYVRDGKQVGWLWAGFLATARCCVYLILAAIFLLPTKQHWERSESISRVLIMFDLSGSMNMSDESPSDGRQPATRLDHLVKFLTYDNRTADGELCHGAFLRDLMVDPKDGKDKNPVFLYAFGGRADDDARELRRGSKPWSSEDWQAFVKIDLHQWVLEGLSDEGRKLVKESNRFDKEQPANPVELANFWTTWFKEFMEGESGQRLSDPDKENLKKKQDNLLKKLEIRQAILTSTSYADSVLSVVTKESNNMVAGLIIIGDGRSNAGSDSTLLEAINRANNAKIPIFSIGIGEVREKINIRLADLRAPEQAPPDEQFSVRVDVDGEGLPDKEFECNLDIYKPNQVPGKDKPVMTLPGKGVFKADGAVPHGTVEFTINPAAKEMLPLIKPAEKDGKPGLEQGEWKFVARVPRDKGEGFVGKEHVSDIPASVHIVDKPLRVLLFAGGPGKDYQFCRRLFLNEVLKKRAEMSVCLQVTDPKGDRAQDVPPERLLKQFPHYRNLKAEDRADDRYYNLAQYDLIIAFDPDWTQVPVESLRLLEEWVDDGGGLIVLAGPINTFQLARGTNAEKLKPVIDLLPVIVEDSRTAGLGVDRIINKPWHLHFPGASQESEYLKLDDEGKDPLDGWTEFFWGKKGKIYQFDNEPAQRGFFTYYPVKEPKPGATVVATYADPQGKITTSDGKQMEQPFLVTGQSKKGKVVYIGWEGMWRLRLYKELFHERFWTKLARFAGSGNLTRQSSLGVPIMGRRFIANLPIRFEAQLKQATGKPLDKGTEVKFKIVPPAGVQLPRSEFLMEPKREGEWSGYFKSQFHLPVPGKYELVLPIPGSGEVLRREFYVDVANPELDNPRPDFAALEQMASEVSKLRVNDQIKTDLRRRLRNNPKPEGVAAAGREENEPRLFFTLQNARAIPECLTLESRVIRNKGKSEDLWTEGMTPSPGMALTTLLVISITGFVLALGLGITAMILFATGRAGTGGLCLAGAVLLAIAGVVYLIATLQYRVMETTVVTTTGTLLFVVVGLLSVEWLTRKLLRLA
jgi:hypothetical protein